MHKEGGFVTETPLPFTRDLDTELSLRTPSAPIPPSSPSSYDVSEERESSPEGSGSESDDSSSQSEHSPEPREEVEVIVYRLRIASYQPQIFYRLQYEESGGWKGWVRGYLSI